MLPKGLRMGHSALLTGEDLTNLYQLAKLPEPKISPTTTPIVRNPPQRFRTKKPF
jgi:hypothetical protein